MMAQWKFRSKIALLFLIVAVCSSVVLFTYRKPLSFSVAAISSPLAYDERWATDPPTSDELRQLKNILQQKYTYLGRGAQSFAFVSADGQYVLKFFRMKRLIPKLKHHLVPALVAQKTETLQSLFTAHKLAWEELRTETGLVFLHLNKTAYLDTQIEITDFLGRKHTIDLDRTEFVVQKKAELVLDYFQRIGKEKGSAALDAAVAAFLKLIDKQDTLHIFDRDKAVSHNYGFVGDQPIHLDIGRLTRGVKPGEHERIAQRIQKWRDDNHL